MSYNGIPITTHQWLQPLYRTLQGKGKALLQFGSPTGIMGFYGASGVAQPTGVGTTGSAAVGGPTGTTFFDMRSNGGTGGNYYTFNDLVLILKNEGLIAR